MQFEDDSRIPGLEVYREGCGKPEFVSRHDVGRAEAQKENEAALAPEAKQWQKTSAK
jgi:hypothetical protein